MRFVAGRGAAAKSHREDAAGRECHGEEDGGTVAESHREELLAGAPWRSCRPGVPWRRVGSGTATSSGKASNLPEGMHHREDAAGRGAAAKSHREAGKERAPAASRERAPRAANKKESGKTHSLKPALVMTALVRVTGARPRGSSQLLLCSLELVL